MKHVKGKRQKLDGGGGDASRRRDPREQLTGNQTRSTISYDQGAARSIYVVVYMYGTSPAFSIYKVDYPYSCSDGGSSPRRLHHLATLKITGVNSFVSVQTQHREWIVGVGDRCTIVFDTKTKEVIHGPDLLNAKDFPVLVSVGDKIYALSSCPGVDEKDDDFEPWFEVLDLSEAKVVDGRLEECSWKELPNPPCFPCKLTMLEFLYPPLVIVQSYLVLGSYILVSLRSNSGTYAFNTISEEWQLVDFKNNLPFVGCATPHGAGGVYLGMSDHPNHCTSREEKPAVVSAYYIKLRPARPSNNIVAAGMSSITSEEDSPAMKLSVTEFPIKSETREVVTGIYFASLDKGSFCSLNWKSDKCVQPCDDEISYDSDNDIIVQLPKKAYIILATYQMENSVLQETEQTVPPAATTQKIAISYKQPEQTFKIRSKFRGFNYPAFITVFNRNE